MGLIGSIPGNNQPCGRAARHQSRSHSSSCGDSIDVAVTLALALLDAQGHALAVDVGDLQGDDLGDAQSRPVGDAECGLVLETRRGFDKANHLVLVQHDRRSARLVHAS